MSLDNATPTPSNLSSVALAPRAVGHGSPVEPTQTLDPEKFVLFDERFNSQAEVPLQVKSGAQYSRALNRAAYRFNSVHNAETQFTLQVSNYYIPNDTQWEDVGTDNFLHIDYPVKWIRIKLSAAASADSLFYVQSLVG